MRAVSGVSAVPCVDDAVLLEDHVTQGVGAGIRPEQHLHLHADGLGAVEGLGGSLVEVVDDEPGHLVGPGHPGFVHVRVVGAVPVVVIEGRPLLPGPLAPVSLVLGAQSLDVLVGHRTQGHPPDLGGVETQVRGLVVPADPVDAHPRVVPVLGLAPADDAARNGADLVGLAADAQLLGIAVLDDASPDQAVLENDRPRGPREGHTRIVIQRIAARPAVALEPHGHVVDVDQGLLAGNGLVLSGLGRPVGQEAAALHGTGGTQQRPGRNEGDELLHGSLSLPSRVPVRRRSGSGADRRECRRPGSSSSAAG